MKSYIKIYGPPILEAIKALEKLAIDMPEVCIMDPIIHSQMPFWAGRGTGTVDEMDWTQNYFSGLGKVDEERCGKIISKSGHELGEYDFFFEWFVKPTTEQLYELLQKVDKTLSDVGVRYTITTK